MRPVETLRQEHLAIQTMLDVLEAALRRLERRQPVPTDMLAGLLRFFEWFVGRSHDRKEERGLFPLLAAQGPDQAAAVANFRRQHRDCRRALVRTLEAFEHLRSRDVAAQQPFVAAAREYAARRRRNVHSEHLHFLPGAGAGPAVAEEERLSVAFQEIERESIGPTGREWFRQAIDDYRDIVAHWDQPLRWGAGRRG